ncbi:MULTISPECIES: ABC transporter substrate-binding protein [Pseudomonas]|uniref:Transporter substrate-binding domain-containing protein n=1 Tax=Pseudomonas sp. Hg7Tf TaxID=3236988 RepID=A0AB39I2Z6_9PSED|nr:MULTISPECIES: transporter substrate-binding domain-containing protein [Pseudomonas]KJK08506.1 ABC transporter substrate-binding protein [Pseudomonas sp. 5]MDD1977895.1 transporter substrate-binding domain-containing protein [Pseudomonas putida]MDH2561113.1 transporter substrate-binding domain-containing protein [Pseudomonas sp. Hg5Tf]QYX46963.1 transporter substrate-binding domain-containing protein [Pseudomonas sp. S11A 273]
MRGWRVVLMILALVANGVHASEATNLPKEVRLASERWEDYTNADGTGIAWDILRKVFEPAGVSVSVISVPYSRAIGLVKRGEADAWVGSYFEELADNLYPRWHFDVDHIYALSLASIPLPSPDNLGQFKLSWVRGYDYQRYLPNVGEYREVQRREGILLMLERKRVDVYIDAQTEVEYVMDQAGDNERSKFRSTHIAELPMYLAFGKTEKGRALMALFDQRMEKLVASGELREIFSKWSQPYPFDQEGSQK